MADVIAFWAAAMAIAVLALPVTFALLYRMPDGGAGFAPITGVLFVSFGYFLLRTAGVLEPGRGGVFLAIVLLAVASAVVLGRSRRTWPLLQRRMPELILAGGLFTVLFLAYVGFRAYDADIAHTEQPMDFLFLNAAIASPDYPPQDPWLAGERVSYYYFGYVEAAVLTQASGVDPAVGYNLSLGFFFAASGAAIASLAAALVRWITRTRSLGWTLGGAAFGVALLLFAGSLYAPFEWAAAHGNTSEPLYQAFGLEWLLPCEPGQAAEGCYTAATSTWYPDRFWFWWEGSRIIPGTITEFPFFSFLLGDLHPHVMAIPGVLLALAVAAHTWRGAGTLAFQTHRRLPWAGLAIAVILAALAFTNTWDVITFAGAFAVAVAVRNFRRLESGDAAKATAGYLLPIAGVGVLLLLPWAVDFSSQASGLLPYTGEGSRPAHVALQFGPLVLLGLAATVPVLTAAQRRLLRPAMVVLPVALLPLVAWLLFIGVRGDFAAAIEARGAGGWVTLALYVAAFWLLATAFLALAVRRRIGAAAAGFAALGVLLLYGAELFLIRDLFYDGSPRLNTMFKLSYQAWILLAAGASVGVVVVLQSYRHWLARAAIAVPAGAVTALALVYALLAVPNMTEGFTTTSRLDGLAYLEDDADGEYQLVGWLRENVDPGDVVIEATGRAWSRAPGGELVQQGGSIDYDPAIGRVGSRAGVPIPVGWYFHEVQWRGASEGVREMLTGRQDRVDSIYTAGDSEAVLEAMDELDASYVVVGRAERSRYVGDLMPDFASFLDTVFTSGDTAVYALPIHEVRGSQ